MRQNLVLYDVSMYLWLVMCFYLMTAPYKYCISCFYTLVKEMFQF